MSALALLVLLAGQAPAAASPADLPAPASRGQAGTEVRALTLTLLGDKGEVVSDVSPDDVALVENGLQRDIVYFARDTRPLWVAILVDTSEATGSAYRLNVVEAIVGLVARLPEGTHYSIWTTGDRPTKLVDYTEDKGAVGAALRRVAPQGGNYTIDALAEASTDLRKRSREGDRTAVVAVTGLGPEFSYLDKEQAAAKAETQAELFLALEVEAIDGDFDTRTRLNYTLERLATATGGDVTPVLSYMGVDTELKKLSSHLVSAYRLRYATVPDLKKRKLELRVARPATRVLIPQLVAADDARGKGR
jgi:VWFA-related protein